jgi:hypothetical protein
MSNETSDILTHRICVRVTDAEYWYLKKRGTSRLIRKLIQMAMKWSAAKAAEKAAEKKRKEADAA